MQMEKEMYTVLRNVRGRGLWRMQHRARAGKLEITCLLGQ